MTSISDGTTTLTPTLIDGYRSVRRAGNIVHPIIANAWPAVTLRPAKPRTGTLSMLVMSLSDALAMDALHSTESTLTLVDGDLPGLNMTYVASGDITVELDDRTRLRWWVRVDFQEIQP